MYIYNFLKFSQVLRGSMVTAMNNENIHEFFSFL